MPKKSETAKAAKKPAKKSAKKIAKPVAKTASRAAKSDKAPPKKKAAKSAKKAAPKISKKAAVKSAGFGLPAPKALAQILDSKAVFTGPLFRVMRDRLIEPGGKENTRDVIRHNGSVVILAIDSSRSKTDPWIVFERQYRHAANRMLWELPAGKLEAGEEPLAGAKRELEEETGYRAKKWTPLVEYFASPGFLGESMKIFLAEGLVAGAAHPEEDEQIEIRLVKLSEALKAILKGEIVDGKTLTAVLLYARKKKL